MGVKQPHQTDVGTRILEVSKLQGLLGVLAGLDLDTPLIPVGCEKRQVIKRVICDGLLVDCDAGEFALQNFRSRYRREQILVPVAFVGRSESTLTSSSPATTVAPTCSHNASPSPGAQRRDNQ
jgi:hypothetical protein